MFDETTIDVAGLFSDVPSRVAKEPGEEFMREGEPPDTMYVVLSGEARILVGNKVVATIGKGDLFGEMALLEDAPRSATVVARTQCEAVPVDQKLFVKLVGENPYFALYCMKIMSRRLRAMNHLT